MRISLSQKGASAANLLFLNRYEIPGQRQDLVPEESPMKRSQFTESQMAFAVESEEVAASVLSRQFRPITR